MPVQLGKKRPAADPTNGSEPPKKKYKTPLLTRSLKSAKLIDAGGTGSGKADPNGGYIAGSASTEEVVQEVSQYLGVPTKQIACVDIAGSQNLTIQDLGKLADDLLKLGIKPTPEVLILIKTGTDHLTSFAYSLHTLFPYLNMSNTGGMCPNGGDKGENRLGSYEDCPVNVKNVALFYQTEGTEKLNGSVIIMEDKAYTPNNALKIRTHGVEGAFDTVTGEPLARLVPTQEVPPEDWSKYLETNAGNPDKLFWQINQEQLESLRITEDIPPNFPNVQKAAIEAMRDDYAPLVSSFHDLKYAEPRAIKELDNALKSSYRYIIYRGSGNGNKRDNPVFRKKFEDIILAGKVLMRVTDVPKEGVSDTNTEANCVPLFKDIGPKSKYSLADLTLHGGTLSDKLLSDFATMLVGNGFFPPKINEGETKEAFLVRYKDYIEELKKHTHSPHPLLSFSRSQYAKEQAANSASFQPTQPQAEEVA